MGEPRKNVLPTMEVVGRNGLLEFSREVINLIQQQQGIIEGGGLRETWAGREMGSRMSFSLSCFDPRSAWPDTDVALSVSLAREGVDDMKIFFVNGVDGQMADVPMVRFLTSSFEKADLPLPVPDKKLIQFSASEAIGANDQVRNYEEGEIDQEVVDCVVARLARVKNALTAGKVEYELPVSVVSTG